MFGKCSEFLINVSNWYTMHENILSTTHDWIWWDLNTEQRVIKFDQLIVYSYSITKYTYTVYNSKIYIPNIVYLVYKSYSKTKYTYIVYNTKLYTKI